MKQGNIVCWQFWDNEKGGCYQSTKYVMDYILYFYPTLTPLAYWRIKSLKPTPTKALLNK